MAAAAPALLAISTAVSVIGTIQAANAQKDAASYNAQLEQNKATMAEQQARYDAERQRKQAMLQIGSMRAAYGSSGVSLDSTPLDVLANSATNAEMDRQMILYGGRAQSQAYNDSANLFRMQGSNAEKAGYFNAASTALLGGYQTYDVWKRTQ